MKHIFFYLSLLTCLLPLSIISQNYNPRNTIIAVDMDDVFVQAHKFDLGIYFLNLVFIKNPSFVWKMATDSLFRQAITDIYSKTGKNNGGSTYNLATTAQLYPAFQPYFDAILKKFHTGRSLIEDVIKLLIDIKAAGYTLIAATNRDRMGFEIIMNHLHFNTLNHGTPLFDAIITGEKSSFMQATIVPNGLRFSKFNPNPRWDNYITSVNAFKPEKVYFKALRDVVESYVKNHRELYQTPAPHIIFFDDQIKNVSGAALSGYDIKAFVVPQRGKSEQMRRDLESIGVIIPQRSSLPI